MAQQNVGTLNSQLNMDNGQFNAAVSQAADKLASSQARMNRTLALIQSKFNDVSATVENTKSKILGLASGYFTFNFVKASIDAGDHINDLSHKTGVAVETLSALSFAAAQSGVAIDDVASSINKMQKNLSEAAHGNKTAADSFKQIHLSIDELRKLTPEQQFLAIADKISMIGDESDRTRALIDVFGKSGASLAPLFANGAAGVQEMLDKAKSLGIVLSKESAERMDAYNDKIVELTYKLTDLAQKGFLFAYDSAKKFHRVIDSVVDKMKGSDLRIDFSQLNFAQTNERMDTLNKKIKQTQDALKAEDDPKMFKKYRQSLIDLNVELDMTKSKALSFYGPHQTDNTIPKKDIKLNPTAQSTGLTDAEKAYNERLKESQKIYDETRTAAERYAAEVDNLDNALRDGFITEDTYSRGIKKAGEEYDKALDKSNDLKDTAKDLGLTFSSAFEDAIVNGKKFNDVLKSIAQDIAKLAIRKAVTEPFVNFFSNSIGSFFGGGRANGGPVTAGMSYDVGEFGREKFIAPANGQIVPYDQIGSGSNLSVVNQFTIQPGSGGQQQNPAALMQQISKLVENTVRMVYADETRNQMRTGGILNPIS